MAIHLKRRIAQAVTEEIDQKVRHWLATAAGVPGGSIPLLVGLPSAYLYFVSKNDGTHQFSATLIEHNKAVEQYQKRPFRRPGPSRVERAPNQRLIRTKESGRS